MVNRLKTFIQDRKANVAVLFALSTVPILFALAMGLDYAATARQWTKLNAIADAAALAAVTPNMMGQSPVIAQAAATNMFLAEAALTPGLNITAANVTIGVIDTPGPTGTSRNVMVNYNSARSTTFAGVLGKPSIAVSHRSASAAVTNPNIDFYVMLDNSPSMAIAATQAGINQMVALTPTQQGCAFACHESNPAADGLGNPGGEDNYSLARNNNITLRIDLVTNAAQNLIQTVQSTEAANNARYRMGIETFNYAFNNLVPINSNLTSVLQQSSNIQVLETCQNGWVTCQSNDNDVDTNWDVAMNNINALMPIPGNGTNLTGDRPQEFLFIVTDGVIDESNGGREIAAMGGNWCTTIKNRGIKIAILYTTYYPLPTNSFYNANVAPFQPSIATSMQNCASANLFYQVATGGDITAALNALFLNAVASAHLTQ